MAGISLDILIWKFIRFNKMTKCKKQKNKGMEKGWRKNRQPLLHLYCIFGNRKRAITVASFQIPHAAIGTHSTK